MSNYMGVSFLLLLLPIVTNGQHNGFRICFKETEGSSQCQNSRSSCSGWSSIPQWTDVFRDDTDNRGGGCKYQWSLEQFLPMSGYEYRLCFREVEGSSQCQGSRNSCTGWTSEPTWTTSFRDDTDNRSGGCKYQWKIESKQSVEIGELTCRVCFQETEGSSQCQLSRKSCSGWAEAGSQSTSWTAPFRDDTDNRSGGCKYQWFLDCVPKHYEGYCDEVNPCSPGLIHGQIDGFRICFKETEGSSQCQMSRSSCSGWSSSPGWTNVFRDDTDNRGGGCKYQWSLETFLPKSGYEYRMCFRETEGSSQCQGNRNSCSGWSSNPTWTSPFRDDTDNRSGGCKYQWKIESKSSKEMDEELACRVCFQETEGSSQCQLSRKSCSGWAENLEHSNAWTAPFRDDTDQRSGGCKYQWFLDCVPKSYKKYCSDKVNPCSPMPPTKRPTELPIISPSFFPTDAPTKIPTDAPTKIPTDAPSDFPTKEPTKLPTTLPPTDRPTELPTISPSLFPTEGPTKISTDAPSDFPTKEPTKLPTTLPTTRPTAPTEDPTQIPTAAPTVEPTEAPTVVPTRHPTESPSGPPTNVPTSRPTCMPQSPLRCSKKCKNCRSITLTGAYGEKLRCPDGWYATGVCGSGKSADCGNHVWHKLKCTEYYMDLDFAPTALWSTQSSGVTKKCGEKYALCGRCGAGKNADCSERHQGTWCCDTVGQVDYKTCVAFQLKNGVFRDCPPGYVITEVCGSGRKGDCPKKSFVSGKCCKFEL